MGSFCARRALALVGLLLLGVVTAATADPAAEDSDAEGPEGAIQEVFLGELVFPQEEGELQTTLSTEIDDETTSLGLAAELGLGGGWQIALELEGLVDADVTGVGRVELEGRYSVMELAPGWHLAAGLALGWAPEPLEESPEDAVFVEPVLILGRDLAAGRIHLFAQLGLEWVVDDGTLEPGDEAPEDEIELVLGGYVATRWGGWVLELGRGESLDGDEEAEMRAAMGVVLALGGGWELGFGGALGIEGDAEDAWLATLTVEF